MQYVILKFMTEFCNITSERGCEVCIKRRILTWAIILARVINLYQDLDVPSAGSRLQTVEDHVFKLFRSSIYIYSA